MLMPHADESTPCKVVSCTQDSDLRSVAVDFDEWMRRVDELFMENLGQPMCNFDDWDWCDEYAGDMWPEDAFKLWAASAGHHELI